MRLWAAATSNRSTLALVLILLLCLLARFGSRWKSIENTWVYDEPDTLFSNEEPTELTINTTGCRIRSMKPLSNLALSYMKPFPPVSCPRKQFMTTEINGGLNYLVQNISQSELHSCCRVKWFKHVVCAYREFERFNDFSNRYLSLKFFQLGEATSRHLHVGSGQQTFRIWCWVDFARVIYHDVLFFLPPPSSPPPLESKFPSEERLSVMVLGVDSMSHMHYQRYFHQVEEFMEGVPHTEFWGYNRVGRNSYPNLVPLLSGLNSVEFEDLCYHGRPNFDECHLLWSDFKAAGYSTAFGEDNEGMGTFTYQKDGFLRQPTDLYLRPVMVEIESFTNYDTDYNLGCSGSQRLYQDVHYEFIFRLMPHLQQGPFFSFLWQTQGIHDHFNYAQVIDKDYAQILWQLKDRGILEHTLVLLLADHGYRMGAFSDTAQGRQEMSQPLLIAIYPEWMPNRFPLAMANLQRNSRSLITTFDLYETLQDVIDLARISDANVQTRTRHLASNARGISLFLPIPDLRDCLKAEIPHHYCLCLELSDIDSDGSYAREAALYAVDRINQLIRPYPQCLRLRLEKVRAAYGAAQSSEGKAKEEEVFQIFVRLQTTPGKGHFDATVLAKSNELIGERTLSLGGPVTRTNKYGHQSYCVQNFRIEMYCYCL